MASFFQLPDSGLQSLARGVPRRACEVARAANFETISNCFKVEGILGDSTAMTPSWNRAPLCALLCLLALANVAFAQTPAPPASPSLTIVTHTLQGTVVPNAAITIQSVPGNPASPKIAPLAARTDSAGQASLNGLPAGRYRVSISAKGFDDLVTDVDIEPPAGPGAPGTSIDAILTSGGARTDSVTVQGVIDAPLEEANTPAVLDRQQVKNLPDRPRTVTEALPLAPAVVRLPDGQLRLSGGGEHRSALL